MTDSIAASCLLFTDLQKKSVVLSFDQQQGSSECGAPQALYRMGTELARCVIERHGKRLDGHARRVTIDLDPTDDATHGAHQLSFFN